MGYDALPKCSRVCFKTGRVLNSGEICFSALVEDKDGNLKRLDFASESWPPPSEFKVVAWWRYLLPGQGEKRVRMAPNDILLELFDRWVSEPLRKEELYVLALLLLRRRVFRYETPANRRINEPQEEGKSFLVVYAPRRETTYSIPVIPLSDERIAVIQDELADLLYSGAEAEDQEHSPLPG